MFYADRLGFDVLEEGGDPPRFGIFRRGGTVLYVDAWHGPPAKSSVGWQVYIHVIGLDEIYAELQNSGIAISRALEKTVYGMREFEIADPDGNVLCFGEDAG